MKDADVQVPAVHWWYKTTSHAAELMAGFYNPTNQDGYSPVFEVLRKHSVTLKFVCLRFHVSGQEYDEALADPEGLSWQVIVISNVFQLLVCSIGYIGFSPAGKY